MPIRWFCHDAAQIKAALFLEMTQWKNFISAFYVCLGTSFRFHKKLGLQQLSKWQKMLLLFFCCCCFFVYVSCMRFITYMFVYHFGWIWCFASIICKKKKGSFGNTASKAWKQQTRFYWVCSWEIMAYATSLMPPSPELSATLLSNTGKCWTLQSQRNRKCEITKLYRCTGRLFRAATRAQRQLLWSLNYLLKMILWKYSIQSLKTAYSVLLSLFTRGNGRCDIPHDA